MEWITSVVVVAVVAMFAIQNLQLRKRNKKLESDVNFWRDLAFQNKPDLSDPKSVEFLRPDKK